MHDILYTILVVYILYYIRINYKRIRAVPTKGDVSSKKKKTTGL